MHKKYYLTDLEASLESDISVFISMASFEDRSLSLINSLKNKVNKFIFFKNRDAGEFASENLRKMEALSNGKFNSIELNHYSPTFTVDQMVAAILEVKDELDVGDIFVDITTFTHEQLLILLKVLSEVIPNKKILIGYNGAAKYSTNTESEVWLSRGVDHIRTVIGYPGNFSPSKKLHLVIIVGFEHERAAALIERFEPIKLTLLRGDKKESVSDSHYETNKIFFDELREFLDMTLNTQTDVDSSYISCVDPDAVKNKVLEIAASNSDFNMVVCPMNTKLSTLGVAMAAIENSNIQVAYGKAIEYNEAGYSSASDMATIFEYKS